MIWLHFCSVLRKAPSFRLWHADQLANIKHVRSDILPCHPFGSRHFTLPFKNCTNLIECIRHPAAARILQTSDLLKFSNNYKCNLSHLHIQTYKILHSACRSHHIILYVLLCLLHTLLEDLPIWWHTKLIGTVIPQNMHPSLLTFHALFLDNR